MLMTQGSESASEVTMQTINIITLTFPVALTTITVLTDHERPM